LSGSDNPRRVYSGYALLVLGVLFWSGNAVIGRAATDADIPPLALNFWRWIVALIVFLAFFGRQTWRQRGEITRHWRFLILFCLVSIVGYNCTFYIALQKTTALQATLIQAILPVLVLLLCFIFLRSPITARQGIGVILSVGGAAMIVVRGDFEILMSIRVQEGDAWALIAVILWSIQAFIARWKPKTIDIMPFMTAMAIIGVLCMAPLYAWETITVRPMPFDTTSILFMLYVGIFASVLGTTMWNEGTFRAGGERASYFGNLYPLFAGGLAILILGETLHWYHITGAILVFAGIRLAIIQPRTKSGQSQNG